MSDRVARRGFLARGAAGLARWHSQVAPASPTPPGR